MSMDHDAKPEPPKPREWWIVQAPGIVDAAASKEAAIELAEAYIEAAIVHVREVLAETE